MPAQLPNTRELRLSTRKVRRSNLPSRREDAEAREQLAIVRRGQALGFGALVLTLATIVTLAAIGQPWVAGAVATLGSWVIVAIFRTGKCQTAALDAPEVVPHQFVRLFRQGLSGRPMGGLSY